MFEKFFRKSSTDPDLLETLKQEEPNFETPNVATQHPSSGEKEPLLKDFLVTRYSNEGRVILHIPVDIFKRAGGRDTITRRIFPDIFDGSWPIWSEDYGDSYAIEVPDNEEKIEELKKRIVEKANVSSNS